MECIIKVTDHCNFQCAYCSVGSPEKNKPLSLEIFKKFCDGLKELVIEQNDNIVSFIWHGGEPTLIRPAFYEEAMSYARDIFIPIGREPFFKMQTNGSRLNAEWIALFKKFNVSLGLSLDGPALLHDQFRRTKNGEVTHVTIMQAIEALRAENINFATLLVVTKPLLGHEKEIVDFFAQQALQVKMNPLFDCGYATDNDNLSLSGQDYGIFLSKIFQHWMQLEDERIVIEPLSGFMHAMLNDVNVSDCSYSTTCGKVMISLGSDGSIYPCGRFSDIQTMRYGSILDQSLIELYNSENAKILRNRVSSPIEESCRRCQYFKLCHSGCAFSAYLKHGTAELKTPLCESNQFIFSYLKDQGLALVLKKLVAHKRIIKMRLDNNKKTLESLSL